MAFSESERANIRRYLGLASLYLKNYSRFEDAITLTQSVSEGGQMPDSSTENLIRNALTKLALVETKLEALWDQAQVVEMGSDQVKINPARGAFHLRMEGRRHIATISNTIACVPIADFFSGEIVDLSDEERFRS